MKAIIPIVSAPGMLKAEKYKAITEFLAIAGVKSNKYANLEVTITNREIVWSCDNNPPGSYDNIARIPHLSSIPPASQSDPPSSRDYLPPYKLNINRSNLLQRIIKVHKTHNINMRNMIETALGSIKNRTFYSYPDNHQADQADRADDQSYRIVISARHSSDPPPPIESLIISLIQEIIIDFDASTTEPRFTLTTGDIFAILSALTADPMDKYKSNIEQPYLTESGTIQLRIENIMKIINAL